MKQFIVYFLAPLITLLLAAMKVSDGANVLKKHPLISGMLDWFVVLGNGFIYYFSILSPHRKFESAQKKKWKVLEKFAKEFCDNYKEYEFGVHVMLVKTKFFYRIEPSKKRLGKKKFTWRGKVFYPARDLAGHGMPPKFSLTTNQGVCGTAYRHGHDTSKFFIRSGSFLPEISTEEEISSYNRRMNKSN